MSIVDEDFLNLFNKLNEENKMTVLKLTKYLLSEQDLNKILKNSNNVVILSDDVN